jgi:hypothetical protein
MPRSTAGTLDRLLCRSVAGKLRTSPVLICLALFSCNPYDQRDGELSAGAVDPANFPPAYLGDPGSGGDRLRAGSGSFTERRAYAGGQAIGYYSFPLSTAQVASVPPPGTPTDPLRLIDNGMPYAKVPSPTVYRFDPASPCVPPKGYVYNSWRDEVDYSQQGSIFTQLPVATYAAGLLPTWSYVPVVSETLVHSESLGCQSLKSEATVKRLIAPGQRAADGDYLAWAIIDVAAPVYRVGETAANSFGAGVQKLGWFNHYIVAYLDGGSIPTEPSLSSSGTASGLAMHPQHLYYPRSMVIKGMTTTAGGIGLGYDVLDAARGNSGYSPVCEVFTYDTGAQTPIDQLPKAAATITSQYGNTIAAAAMPNKYVFCLQVLR